MYIKSINTRLEMIVYLFINLLCNTIHIIIINQWYGCNIMKKGVVKINIHIRIYFIILHK